MKLVKRRVWKRIIGIVVIAPLLLFGIVLTILIVKKDAIVSELLETLNEDFHGRIAIRETRIAPFQNFPYISVDLKGFQVFETKEEGQRPFLELQDVYAGFDFWTVVKGNFEIKTIALKNGHIHIEQDENHRLNILKAFESTKEIEDISEEFHLDLQRIDIEKVDILKKNTGDSLLLEAFVERARTRFKSTETHINIGLDSDFVLNIINHTDTSFVKNKHLSVHTSFSFDKKEHLITFAPSEVQLENGIFGMEGSADIDDDFNIDLRFHGKKPNFDLLIAFAPDELAETLSRYDNRGDIFFEATVKGKSVNGYSPAVEANFGCKAGFFDNKETRKKLDEMFFTAYFTNGEERNLSTSEFVLKDFSAKPEAGIFKGNLSIKNFISPEIDMQLESDFDLEFLSKFFNLNNLSNLNGKVSLTMNFHDIIDLEHPEKSLEKFNQAYYSELLITNLNFQSDSYHLPIRNLNLKATMDGNDIVMDYFNCVVGRSDISMDGNIRNIPAIVHKTDDEVRARVTIRSSRIDFKELTSGDTINQKPFNEELSNVAVGLRFKGAANTFIQSKSLPEGNFFIEDFYGKLKNYPHTFHDFDAKIFIRENFIKVVNFDGMIDDSDFRLTGKVDNYNLWMQEQPDGDTRFEWNISSNLIRLEDLFSYNGENYVPEDYRHEEIREFQSKGSVDIHFKEGIQYATDLNIETLKGRMKVHPMKFENFSGNLHFENHTLALNRLSGKIGKSNFIVDGNCYLGDKTGKEPVSDRLMIRSDMLDFDELFAYNPPVQKENVKDHEDAFNLFELPFRDIILDAQIKELNYHKYRIKNISSKIRVKTNHYVYIDQMRLDAAGGKVDLKGYFNGSDPTHIYFNPDLKIQKVNLDEVLFKFDNFGQDQLVSDNLHGIFTGRITGKILMYPDLTPRIDESDLQIDVSVVNGRIENFGPMDALSDFFKDKNLAKVLFDKLENRIQLKNGKMDLPNMVINSSLGFMELSGSQDMDMNMEYYIRVPLKLVTRAASQKLFGKQREIDPDQEDEIIYKDERRKVSYINLKITGTPSNYKISLQKNKDLKKGSSQGTFLKDESFLFDPLETDSIHAATDHLSESERQ